MQFSESQINFKFDRMKSINRQSSNNWVKNDSLSKGDIASLINDKQLIEYSNVEIHSSFKKNSPGSTKVLTGFRKQINNRIKNL